MESNLDQEGRGAERPEGMLVSSIQQFSDDSVVHSLDASRQSSCLHKQCVFSLTAGNLHSATGIHPDRQGVTTIGSNTQKAAEFT
jgi:hypothetical protein